MSTYITFKLFLLIYPAFALKQFYPDEIVSILKNSCVVVFLTNADVYLPENASEILTTLSAISFQSEPLVEIGYVNFKSFKWQHNQTLKEIKNEELSANDIVLFPKTKKDRTCLLPAKTPAPKVFKYKGALSLNLISEFMNTYCNTYRTVNGGLSIEGLHRQDILQNLFSVSTVSSVTSEKIFKSKLHKESIKNNINNEELDSCVKDDDNECNNHDKSVNYNIPKCDRIKMPSKEEFFHTYLKLSKPVIIEGALTDLKVMHKWSNNFLRETYGDKNVHIKLTSAGEFEGVEPAELWDNFKTFRIPDTVQQKLEFPDLVVVRPATLKMKFSALVDLVENISDGAIKNVSAYLEYSSIPEHLPELEEDLEEMPFVSDLLDRQHLNIWFSDGNTLGKLHFDPFDNLLCQISGRKQVILFEPHDNTKLYESHIPEAMLSYNHASKRFSRKQLAESTSMVMSPVDLAKVDYLRFPKFRETYPINCTLDEGDVLFMPAFWWHEVQSFPNRKEKRNLAVNYWYEPFLTKEFPCSTCKLDINPKYRNLL